MSTVLMLVLVVAAAGCLVLALYLLLLLCAACLHRRQDEPAEARLRIVVAVPAHNEQGFVGRTVRSVQDCDYPKGLREVVVIADNCTDATAAEARALGATVLERRDEDNRGKGHALSFFVTEYLRPREEVDAVVVIDADTFVSPNLLSVVNHVLLGGAQVGQVCDAAANANEGWRPAMQFISLALKNHVRALGRETLGCTAGLFGNGMFFSRETLVTRGWPARSIVEDTEFGLELLLAGVRVRYAPEVSVLALMPTGDAGFAAQKTRWESGQLRMARRYIPSLVSGRSKAGWLNALLWVLELLTPPLVLLFVVCVAVMLAAFAAWMLWPGALAGTALAMAGLAWVFLVTCAVGGLLLARAPACVWRSLLALPVYAVWKLRVYGHTAWVGGPSEWVRTDRQ